jgi:ribosomal protein S18 acetylase RimI-like enzyme
MSSFDARQNPQVETLYLEVVNGNSAGQKLYKSFGFVDHGVIPNMMKYSDGTYADWVPMTLATK